MVQEQKRALYGLLIAVGVVVACLVIFINHGVSGYFTDPAVRIPVAAVFAAGALIWGAMMWLTRGRGRTPRDERDILISNRALKVQLISVFTALFVWAVSLTEIYFSAGLVPVVFPFLIFLSVIFVNLIAQAVAVLILYRRLGGG